MKTRVCLLFFNLTIVFAFAQEIKVTSGSIKRFADFNSKFVDARNIDVWLPNNYSAKEKYAVLYMHDGQMLYDASTTWNKQSWEVDSIAGKLIQEHKTQKFIVVGIWNNNKKRHLEYFPQKVFESLNKDQKAFVTSELIKMGRITENFSPLSDNYLKFLVTELKPFIDKTFATKSDQANTFISGSSMGGLISMYAICEYPNVFGGAACLSTHWPGIFSVDNNPIPDAFVNYLKAHLPNPKNHKIYFDYGDQTLDAMYKPFQEKVDVVMKEKGFSAINWTTKFFPGKDHSEKSWRERFSIPLVFLLGK
jgi:enterochelin esterase-like enzyme